MTLLHRWPCTVSWVAGIAYLILVRLIQEAW